MKKNLLIIIASLVSSFIHAQDARSENLSQTFEKIQDSLGFNGIIAATERDSLFFVKSAGFANMEFQVPVSSDTKFRIASLSKPIISYAIYILVDQGKINFKKNISTYIPNISKEIGDSVLVEHLINHTGGLIRDFDILHGGNASKHYTRDEIVDLINQSKLQSIPGDRYSYSNTGYTLLAMIIENVMDRSLNESLKMLLFTPLNMNATGHEERGVLYTNFSSGYDALGETILKSSYEDKSHVHGAGSLYSTVTDLSKFASEVIKGSLMSDETYAKYITDKGGNVAGGGWITWTYGSRLPGSPKNGQILYFSGSCPGYRSFMGIYLEHEIAVIGLMNKVPINTSLLNNKFGNIMLGYDPEEISKPAFQVFLPSILDGDLSEVKARYYTMISENSNSSITAQELNQTGYLLLSHGRISQAIKVFSFMTMIYPDNSNAFDSLGEALIANGDIEEGVEAYKKSLELNPANGNALAMLEQYSD